MFLTSPRIHVVPARSRDSRSLAILVQMLTDGHRFLDQEVQILNAMQNGDSEKMQSMAEFFIESSSKNNPFVSLLDPMQQF